VVIAEPTQSQTCRRTSKRVSPGTFSHVLSSRNNNTSIRPILGFAFSGAQIACYLPKEFYIYIVVEAQQNALYQKTGDSLPLRFSCCVIDNRKRCLTGWAIDNEYSNVDEDSTAPGIVHRSVIGADPLGIRTIH
jgi:hypothetical protein